MLATQKPTVDVITGLIKSNLPARIAFQVASRTDSRVVLDEMGADKLLGNGDMLFLWPGTSTLLRGQGTYVSDDEINNVIEFVGTTEPQFVKELVQLKPPDADGENIGPKTCRTATNCTKRPSTLIVREGRGSVSLLQRGLGIGYGRAARLVDFMAEDGIVGQYNGSQAREVLLTVEQWEEMSGSGGVSSAKPAEPRRNNKIMLAPAEERRSTGPRAVADDGGSVAVAEEDEEDEELEDSDEPIDDDDDAGDADEPESEEDLEEELDDDPDEYDEAEPRRLARPPLQRILHAPRDVVVYSAGSFKDPLICMRLYLLTSSLTCQRARSRSLGRVRFRQPNPAIGVPKMLRQVLAKQRPDTSFPFARGSKLANHRQRDRE